MREISEKEAAELGIDLTMIKPWVVAIAMAKERKVKLMPITIGRREPIRHTG